MLFRPSCTSWVWRLLVVACLPGCTPGSPVTGGTEDQPTFNGSQAETASASAQFADTHVLIVAYNDDTYDGKVRYGASGRTVLPGASLLGFSYSTNDGLTWTYGGKVSPPPGIAALWGDPAIVTSKTNPNRVYVTELAADDQIVPAGGKTGSMATSGACVAHSADGGRHFSIMGCFGADRDFYDGAALAAGGAPYGDIYAAYTDLSHNRIDVWKSAGGIGPFQGLGDPFPNMQMLYHPRLAFDDANGALIVAAIGRNPVANDSRIYMNRLVGNNWQAPVMVSQPASGVQLQIGTQAIRTASGFAFDIGAQSQGLSNGRGLARFYPDAIRLLYTTRDSATQRIYVRGTGCTRDLGTCEDVPQWGTTPGNFDTDGDSWNPTVKAWPGSSTSPATWMATYQTTDDRKDRVSIKKGTLSRSPSGDPSFQPLPLMTPRIVCPDKRYQGAGYWGDYDESAHVGFSASGVAQFLLAFTDSSKGCVTQTPFHSAHVHVRAIRFQ